ncbi:HNH endonuclease [Brevibacillus centrosporus]|uniref:HNH endonuclease n=1 Tax=Brevibacillus centrosporus TaxID=54910 RepID=UPI002E20836A|nr:HNH endonuclease [Brevibacillus centrosporus]
MISPSTTRDGNYCQYCGGTATGFDHIIPTSKGGLDLDENKVPCCVRCNNAKATQTLAAFLNGNRDFINDDVVQTNRMLMQHVRFNYEKNGYVSRDVTGHVTVSHATEEDIEEELEQEIDKEKEKRKKKRTAPAKVKCAEFVSLSEEEQKTLVNEFGADDAARLIELLNNYKGATGKTYKSDYMAIRNWVINRLQEEKRKISGRVRSGVIQDELPKSVQKQQETQSQGGFEQKSITFEEWKEERRARGDYAEYSYMDFFNAIGGAT